MATGHGVVDAKRSSQNFVTPDSPTAASIASTGCPTRSAERVPLVAKSEDRDGEDDDMDLDDWEFTESKELQREPWSAYREPSSSRLYLIMFLVMMCGLVVGLAVWEQGLRAEGQSRLEEVLKAVVEAPVQQSCDPAVLTEPSNSEEARAAKMVVHEVIVTPSDRERLDLHPLECCLLGTVYYGLLRAASSSHMQFLSGAHMVVNATGELPVGTFYAIMTHMRGAYQRMSSHSSSVPQYGVPEGRILRTLLTGRQVDPPQRSWFQVEGAEWSPLKHPLDSLLHLLNWIRYKVTGLQVGPLGSSKFTDKNPLVVVVGAPVEEEFPDRTRDI